MGERMGEGEGGERETRKGKEHRGDYESEGT